MPARYCTAGYTHPSSREPAACRCKVHSCLVLRRSCARRRPRRQCMLRLLQASSAELRLGVAAQAYPSVQWCVWGQQQTACAHRPSLRRTTSSVRPAGKLCEMDSRTWVQPGWHDHCWPVVHCMDRSVRVPGSKGGFLWHRCPDAQVHCFWAPLCGRCTNTQGAAPPKLDPRGEVGMFLLCHGCRPLSTAGQGS